MPGDLCKESSDRISLIPVAPPTQMGIDRSAKRQRRYGLSRSRRVLLASVKLLSFSFASGEFVAPTNTLGMCTREKCRLHANRATRLIVRLWLTCCPADEEILTKNLTGAIRFSRNVTEVPKAYNFITRWPPRCATIDRRKKCQTLFLRLG